MDRWPYPFIQMNPDDMTELKLKQGDLVEVYNDNGSTQAMVYPTPTAKRKQTFMLFAYPTGVQGNVVSAGVNEFIMPNYKQTWGEYPQDRGRSGGSEASQLQVARIHRLTSPPLSTSAGRFRRPAITGNRPGAQNVLRTANLLTLGGFSTLYFGLIYSITVGSTPLWRIMESVLREVPQSEL